MNEQINVVQNKQARGYILKVLKINYPHSTGTNIIDVCLVDVGINLSNSKLMGHVKYLEDRGYIQISNVELQKINKNVQLIELTSKGVDLLEGTIKDPGVMFDGI